MDALILWMEQMGYFNITPGGIRIFGIIFLALSVAIVVVLKRPKKKDG